MKKFAFIFVVLFGFVLSLTAQEREVKLKIVQTSDVHGNYYPYNFITQKDWAGSLARVHAFVQKKREIYKDNLILLDNGDILQGQPTAYYYNYIDTVSPHLCAEMMNYMGYDAGNMGNHDVETGRRVFDRWISECNFPVLGANIIDTATGETHLKPYKVMERDGVKIVVLGMITPAIPAWLSENLWKGLRFDDMEQTAKKWMKIIREKEKPDLVIGLFHAGQDAFLPKMYTDITLKSSDKVLIIDTKCYRRILSQQYDKKSVCSANLYQIYAYVKNKSAATDKTVSGMLLYAKTDEDITPDVAYSMGGNKIFVRTLDLNCEFEKIKEQLDKIVAENFTV